LVKKYEYFLFSLFIFFSLIFLYLYNYIGTIEKTIFTQIEKNHITHLNITLKYLATDMLNDVAKDGNLLDIIKDKDIRISQEKKLNSLISKNVQYAYIIFRDKHGKYRFLLDGSTKDKAHFYQRFDVENPKIYDKAYVTKTPQIIIHKKMQNLWLTDIYPIVYKNHTIALISLDTTTHLEYSILKLIQPIKHFFMLLIIFVMLLFLVGIINTIYSIRVQKKLFIDPLTQLYNRKYLAEIEPKLSLNKYAIAMLDIDHFKVVNDTYGHKAGDYVLQECSRLFQENVRESDIIIRYGGEEFLCFINKRAKDKENNAYMVLQRLREAIKNNSFIYDNIKIACTISIGLENNPEKEKNLGEAIKKVDQMLYIAKESGRNRVQVSYDTYQEKTILDINVTRDAIENDMVVCQYQTIYNPYKNQVLKYEALVRLKKKDGSLIYPDNFLPALKHTNVYFKLTKQILRINFNRFKQRNDAVSINLSFNDIMNEDIIKFITKELQEQKELASRITFEVLESDEITNVEKFQTQLKKLHLLGCEIAIDDFGSGFANFKMVLDIEADILKIDGSLIKEINENEKVYMVVKNIILFAKDVGMKTIAEFVSSKEIYDTLLKLDIDYMQGFYIAKPTLFE